MAFDRRKWTEVIRRKWAPAWPCPTCRKGTLRLRANTLVAHETVRSKRAHSDEEWDPEWCEYTFTAWLKCSNSPCGEDVAVTGSGGEDIEYEQEEGMMLESYYIPKYVRPALELFDIPKKCPKSVRKVLRDAFALYWHDYSATANRIRIAIERLLDDLGVKKRRKDKSGGFQDLSLHQRIEEFTKTEPQLGGQLMALKWVGNVGSHDVQVERDDLLDAFEILEHTLSELVNQRTKLVTQLAKKLHAKHGRRMKSTRRKKGGR